MERVTTSLIDRRTMLLGVGALPVAMTVEAPPHLPIPPGGQLAFQIRRKGDKIGEHSSVFDVKGDALTINSHAEIVVHMIGIPVFRYMHRAVERWQGGSFMSLETTTNDDGTEYWVRVERQPAGLVVTGSAQKRYVAPPEALAMTHWNRTEVSVPKINPQKGDLLRPTVSDRGMERIATASGAMIAARHYNFSGQAILDLWYDTEDHWAGLAFLGGDQSQITLERA